MFIKNDSIFIFPLNLLENYLRCFYKKKTENVKKFIHQQKQSCEK